MGASNGPGWRLQIVGPPIALGLQKPAIIELLCEYATIFANPVFLPANCVAHDMYLKDNTTKPSKPKQYHFLLAKQTGVWKQLDKYLKTGWIRLV